MLIANKLHDHHCPQARYLQLLQERCAMLQTLPELAQDFRFEMRRFLPANLVASTAGKPEFWQILQQLVGDLAAPVERQLQPAASQFDM